jgi:hypothetical protein
VAFPSKHGGKWGMPMRSRQWVLKKASGSSWPESYLPLKQENKWIHLFPIDSANKRLGCCGTAKKCHSVSVTKSA